MISFASKSKIVASANSLFDKAKKDEKKLFIFSGFWEFIKRS